MYCHNTNMHYNNKNMYCLNTQYIPSQYMTCTKTIHNMCCHNIKTCTITIHNVYCHNEYIYRHITYCHNKNVLSQYIMCTVTIKTCTVTIRTMCTYQILNPALRMLLFWDVSTVRMSEVVRFRSCFLI